MITSKNIARLRLIKLRLEAKTPNDCMINELRSFGALELWSVRLAVGRRGLHLTSRVIPKYFKKWYSQLTYLALSTIEIVCTTSRQACLLCPWARHLTGCLHFYVVDRWWGQAVYPS